MVRRGGEGDGRFRGLRKPSRAPAGLRIDELLYFYFCSIFQCKFINLTVEDIYIYFLLKMYKTGVVENSRSVKYGGGK